MAGRTNAFILVGLIRYFSGIAATVLDNDADGADDALIYADREWLPNCSHFRRTSSAQTQPVWVCFSEKRRVAMYTEHPKGADHCWRMRWKGFAPRRRQKRSISDIRTQ